MDKLSHAVRDAVIDATFVLALGPLCLMVLEAIRWAIGGGR